ncbi:MAG: glycosyltransferase family 2 protein [Acidimicrobiia bacterium]
MAAVVVAHEPSQLALCLDTIGRQVYEPAHLFVVGDDEEVRRIAKARQASWRPTVASVLESVPADVTFLWLLHSGARPRPDALAALVSESQRVDASVAGSKILLADRPEVLLSVGMATDVFDAPYSGLEEGELDQEQYDVVRDVAAVPGSSMLIRRDLMVGLKGPDPLMAPNAASIDFCQRARLRGGRIVVIPSSEVLFERPAAADGWREHAGQIRSMAKVYSLLTLLWALPLAFVVGVAESIVSPLLGRWRLFGFVRAWGWNVVHLPSLLIARRQARRGRVVGDEELFRHQMNGSARLFALFQEAGERIRGRFPKGVLGGFSDVVAVGQQSLRRPAFVTGLVAVGLALLATRGIWGGRLPAVGFSLPPPESAGDALRAYAGGWNPAGLGTPKPLRPAVGATALLQHVFLGKAGLTAAGLTVLAFIGGVFGTARLLRRWGIGSVAGYLAGLVLMGGPATRALAGDAHWTALLALGVLPWVLAAALLPWPDRWIGRAGRAASLALLTGLAAAYLPLLLVVPVASLALWSALGMGPMWGAASRAGASPAL